MAVVTYNKKYTETLGAMLERFRNEFPRYRDEKITYAGRLDPMAEGLMLLLTGDDVYTKEQYLDQAKVYQVDVLVGMSTDSLDILGLINHSQEVSNIDKEQLHQSVGALKNITKQTYPIYSSKTVNGKPLWQWARDNRLSEITLPQREVNIYDAQLLEIKSIQKKDCEELVLVPIGQVQGDFRQKEIIDSWKNYFQFQLAFESTLISLEFHVSSGTYIRGLVQSLSGMMNIPMTCLKIKRLQIGEYK